MRYAIREPHAGGLESSVWHHVRLLRERGHTVTFCAVEGSDFLDGSPAELRLPAVAWPAGDAISDVDYPPGYLEFALPRLEAALAWLRDHRDDFDIVDNHCLNPLPLEWAGRLGIPMVSTLHTPTLPGLVDAHARSARPRSSFLAVSDHTRQQWQGEGIEAEVVLNGIDTDLWPLGPGGDDLVWFGRIVPEKGPHLAIDAARLLGRDIRLAGRVGDVDYARREVWPRLGPDAAWLGELGQSGLAALVGHSACALITPVWHEPFGLVIAEALSCGTPVASFSTGGVPEVVGDSTSARLVAMGDVAALAAVAADLMGEFAADPHARTRTRADAVARHSLHDRVAQIELVYRRLIDQSSGRAA
ncbi:MAG: glycosyltransferase [Burkholderiaceae bacterium]|nr:glycosyltransferase [Microbacteriaceae bacterium]